MLKYFDVECEECGFCEEVFINDKDDISICPKCNGNRKRIFTSFNFKLIYNNKTDVCGWGDNNYDTSQYYRKVNEARANGQTDAHAPD